MTELACLILGKEKVKTVDELDFKKEIKSDNVLVKPEVISKFLSYAASSSDEERAALLIGRLEGTSIIITDIRNCKKGKSTAASVEIDSQEMCEIAESLDKGSFIVGWAHSHIGYSVFMSGTDIHTQLDFQTLFSDAVAMVLDPFKENGKIGFGFFRIVDGKTEELKYSFLVNKNDAQ